jgi:pilus assembly protein CpaB
MASQAPPARSTTPNWSGGFRRRLPFYILIAIFFSLLAGVLAFVYLEDARARMLPSIPVVVAARDLEPGTRLSVEELHVMTVPEAIVPSDALREISQASGRVLSVPIREQQVVLESQFIESSGKGISSHLPKDHWAFVMPTAWLASPVPSASAGDHFDLMAYQPGRPADEVGVIVSRVRLLNGTESGAQIILVLTLEEAKTILYARANGFTLVLLLRPEGT